MAAEQYDLATLSHHDIFFSTAKQIIRKQTFPFFLCLTFLPWCSVTHCLQSAGCKSMSDTFPLVGRLFNYYSSRYLNFANY